MRAAILQSNYIPWPGYFSIIAKCDAFVFYDTVQYTTGDWRNRNRIRLANNAVWLTIPVEKKNRLSRTIIETYPVDTDWVVNHLQSIYHGYRRARNFYTFYPYLANAYKTLPNGSLSQINKHLIKSICCYLGLDTKFFCSSEMRFNGSRSRRLVEICKLLGATSYVTGKSAANYLDLKEFASASIDVSWVSYEEVSKPYPQCSECFLPKLSIIDLLFNLDSSEAANFIR